MKVKIFFAVLFFTIFSVFAQSTSPFVRDIQTTPNTDSVVVTWTLPNKDILKDVVEFNVYRSNQAFTKPSQLNNDTFIKKVSKNTNYFNDINLAENAYFYAVIAKLSSGKLFDVLIPSENVTVFAVSPLVQEKQSKKSFDQKNSNTQGIKEGTIRETPLPYLRLIEEDLSPQTGKNDTESSVFKKNFYEPTFYIFEEDSNEQAIGDDYALYSIITNYVYGQKYDNAIKELNKMLNTKHDDNITARIYFYLGECNYFKGELKSAINNFLLAEKVYPYVAKRWQQYSIDAFELPNTSK